MGGVMEICKQANLDPGIKYQENEERIESFQEIQGEEVAHQELLADLQQLEKNEAFTQFRENKVLMKHKGREEYYLGEWADGIKKGQGLAYRQGEYLYYGSFGEASKDSGYLKLYKQQLIVEGQLKGGKPDGECTVRDFSNTFTYKGLISEQKPSSGVFKVTNSVDPQLSYTIKLEDYPQNNAIIQYQNGSNYEGKISISTLLPEGFGKAVYQNGTSYEGRWVNGLYNDTGRFLWLDGSFYEGGYEAGVKKGNGKYRYSSGKTYEGGWLNGRQEGQGILYSSDGVILKQGLWQNGKYIGHERKESSHNEHLEIKVEEREREEKEPGEEIKQSD